PGAVADRHAPVIDRGPNVRARSCFLPPACRASPRATARPSMKGARRTMRRLAFLSALAAIAVSLASSAAAAQTPTGTISGRVVDSGGLAVPGATVTVTSPNLQGSRTAISSANGDYIFPSLPAGQYTVTFELSGFATIKAVKDVAPSQTLTVDVTMKPAAVSEEVTVSARVDAFTNTVQNATNI